MNETDKVQELERQVKRLEELLKQTASGVSSLADQVIRLAEVTQNMLNREIERESGR
jgi:hypothetical protein